MTARIPFSQLEWRGKPVAELNRDELLKLVESLHTMVWDSAENFDTLLAQAFPHIETIGRTQ